MMKMADLERAEPQRAAGRTSGPWGIRQRLTLLGVVITLLALVLGTFSLLRRPKPPVLDIPPEQIRENFRALSPLQSWRIWRSMRDRGLDRSPPPGTEQYDEELLQWRLQMGVVLFLAAGGIALIVVPPLTKPRPKAGSR